MWPKKTRAGCSPASRSWTFPAPRVRASTGGAPGSTVTYERIPNPQRPGLRRPRRPGFCGGLRHRGETGAIPRVEGKRQGAQRSRRHPGRSRGPGPVLDHRRRHALAAGVDEPQIGSDWHFEEVRPQKPRREEQHLEILNLTGIGVEPRDYLVRQFLRLLLRVRRALVDVEDVGLPIVFESQHRLHRSTALGFYTKSRPSRSTGGILVLSTQGTVYDRPSRLAARPRVQSYRRGPS